MEALGDIVIRADESVRDDILDLISEDQVVVALEPLATDDAAFFLSLLRPDSRERVLQSIPEEQRQPLRQILSYPESTAGSLMQALLITLRSDTLVKAVLRYLRLYGPLPNNVNNLFVVDQRNVLLGDVFINQLLSLDPDSAISEVMNRDIVAIPAATDQEEVARIFKRYDLLSAPVVDDNGKLLGRITVDDVLEVVAEEAEEDLLLLGGVSQGEDLLGNPWEISLRRSIWLGVNLLTAIAASYVVSLFDQSLSKMVALAVLMPIVASMGGNSGGQTATAVVRALALGQINAQNIWTIVVRQASSGVISGTAWALLVGTLVTLWFEEKGLGLVIGSAMIINLFTAGIFGALIPVTLHRLKIDPALASMVLLTTITDVTGFFVFLGLASWWLF